MTHDFVYGANMNVDDIKTKKQFSIINPIKNNQLQIFSKNNGNASKSKLEIFSMDGKLVESKQVDLKSGANLIDVKLQKLQNYILKISDGTTTETFRISN